LKLKVTRWAWVYRQGNANKKAITIFFIIWLKWLKVEGLKLKVVEFLKPRIQ
jgi:hypothetical protein